jgi:hypothetical protein
MSILTPAEHRAQFVRMMREFADLIESTPTIPTPNSVDIWAFLHAGETTQAERFDAVHDFAEAQGVPVKEDYKNDLRAETILLGLIKLRVHAYADAARDVARDAARIVTRTPDARRAAAEAAVSL